MADSSRRYSIYNDEELMRFVCQGQVPAFDELYHRYSGRMMVYFVRMLNFNKAHAEDALQDLFMKIVEKPSAFDSGRPFRTWIYSVASNACKNYYRHLDVKKRSEPYLLPDSFENDADFYRLAARLDSE